MLRKILFLLTLLVLGACATPGSMPIVDTSTAQGEVHPILVATTRAKSSDSLHPYSAERSDELFFDDVAVWVPANRMPGSVTYPSKRPSPDKEFAVTERKNLSKGEFTQHLNNRLAKLDGKKTVTLFIHGYNVSYSEGVYRTAQIDSDFDNYSIPVHFSWPSSGRIVGYIYDRDSVQFARDGLIKLLNLIHASDAESLFLVSHSMGTLLTMEAMRHLSLAKQEEILKMISPLILASPDIDVDVFRSQVESLSERPDPILVFVAKDDNALSVSKFLRGGHQRIGEGGNIAKLQEHGIAVIDLTNIDTGDSSQHSAFSASPELIKLIQQSSAAQNTLNEADEAETLSPLEALGQFTKGLVFLPKRISQSKD